MIHLEIKQKPFEFGVLFLILAIAAILFFYFDFDPHNQRRIIYATSTAYFFWSLFYHYRKGDLELSLVVEYLTFALLATILISATLM